MVTEIPTTIDELILFVETFPIPSSTKGEFSVARTPDGVGLGLLACSSNACCAQSPGQTVDTHTWVTRALAVDR